MLSNYSFIPVLIKITKELIQINKKKMLLNFIRGILSIVINAPTMFTKFYEL